MDFRAMIQPTTRSAVFTEPGYKVWCTTMVEGEDGLYYMYYSRWKEALGHFAWVSHSEVAYAVGENPMGPFEPKGLALGGRGGDYFDADCIHNPTVVKIKDKYYIYYMGTKGMDAFEGTINSEDPAWWVYRNNQRVGVAWADHPAGPWHRLDQPVIDVTPGSHDHLMTSNPSAALGHDGNVYLVYKAVSNGLLPKGGAVVCGVATCENPLGPFIKYPKPIMVNPVDDWSVEDPFIWCQEGIFYALAKDFQGYFTGGRKHTVALFESEDGFDWQPADKPFAFDKEIYWEDGSVTEVGYLERPQILMKDGKPAYLICAGSWDSEKEEDFSIRIPLK